jgi:hypothetical protein
MTDFVRPGHGPNMGAQKSFLNVMVGGRGLFVAGLVLAAAGCAVDGNPYLSLGENLDATAGDGGEQVGSGGGTDVEAGAGGTGARGDEPAGRDGGGTGGSAGSLGGRGNLPEAGMGGTSSVPSMSGAGGQAGTMNLPDAGAGGSAAGSMNCPLIACSPEFARTYDIEDTFGETIELSAEICQNEVCLEAELNLTRADIGPGAGIGRTVPEPDVREREELPLMSFTILGGLEGGIEVRLDWRLWRQEDATNGDRYRIRVETLDGELVVGEELAFNYERVEIAACTSCLVAQPAPED